ncbi:MAG TPA: hypothetical protein VLM40_07620 [Gemmata sp.]|nr:hypothetical protein [Gemmata sp.]
MREFVVTLRCGKRYTVKADRLRREDGHLMLVASQSSAIGDLDPFHGVIALFDERQVAVVIARDHLIAEEEGSPVDPHYVASDGESNIPF